MKIRWTVLHRTEGIDNKTLTATPARTHARSVLGGPLLACSTTRNTDTSTKLIQQRVRLSADVCVNTKAVFSTTRDILAARGYRVMHRHLSFRFHPGPEPTVLTTFQSRPLELDRGHKYGVDLTKTLATFKAAKSATINSLNQDYTSRRPVWGILLFAERNRRDKRLMDRAPCSARDLKRTGSPSTQPRSSTQSSRGEGQSS